MSLNFKEKRALQKTVSEKQAALKSGTLGFKEKREAQKALRDAMAKLGAGTPAPQPAASRPDVSGVKARFTAERVMDVPDGWIVMNAPRPLLGTKTLEGGPFMSGRFYAAIDPADSMAAGFVAENIKLDARVVLQGISTELQIEMALVDNKYADTYRSDFQGDELLDALATQINDLQDKTVAELESIIARAKGGAATPQTESSVVDRLNAEIDAANAGADPDFQVGKIGPGINVEQIDDRNWKVTLDGLDKAVDIWHDQQAGRYQASTKGSGHGYGVNLSGAVKWAEDWLRENLAGTTPDPAPDGNESPFQPLINGDLNNLPMPDFVKRLEAAYAEEESLEKAKQAAIGYLEANRAKLEAA